ncbi:MAG: hypothetical protein ACRDJG_12585 [Actinomycetota bacterium]
MGAVESICRVLQEPTSTYYVARNRPAPACARRDAELLVLARPVYGKNYGVYGARRVWSTLRR